MNKKIGCIIEARMGSSRLPGKVLKKIENKTIIELLIERIKKVKQIEKIIIATSTNEKDNILEKYCIENKIEFFRGSEQDVMSRVLECAKSHEIETIVEITSDCPLIDPIIISQMLNCYNYNNVDYIGNSNIRSYPDGMDVQIFSYKTLKDSYKKSKTNLEKEHVTLHIRKSDEYSKIDIIAPNKYFYPTLGLTLDEEKDFLLIKKIYEHFGHNEFGLDEILGLLFENDNNLLELNNTVERKGDN